VYLMAACWVVARRRGIGRPRPRANSGEIGRTALAATPAMLMPVFVLGGMVAGIVTATEAAAVAALYSLFLGLLHRELRWSHAGRVLTETTITTSVIYLLLGVFNLLGWILAIEQVPQAVTRVFLDMTDSAVVALLIMNVILLLLGMIMEPVPMMILLGPMLIGISGQYGVDPVHFGVVFVLNTLIGVVTPPIGLNMFIACALARAPIGEFTREAMPFLVALVLLLLMITYIPGLTLWLPELLMR
jgi:C4-dicarboxylate transporter, DctM subunit